MQRTETPSCDTVVSFHCPWVQLEPVGGPDSRGSTGCAVGGGAGVVVAEGEGAVVVGT